MLNKVEWYNLKLNKIYVLEFDVKNLEPDNTAEWQLELIMTSKASPLKAIIRIEWNSLAKTKAIENRIVC